VLCGNKDGPDYQTKDNEKTRDQELDNRMFCHHIKSEPRAKTFSDFVGLFDLFSCVITYVHISSCDMKTSPGSFETPSCVLEVIDVPSMLRLTRKPAVLTRVLPTFPFNCGEKPRGGSGTGRCAIAAIKCVYYL
jgi:hypothetical protein